jgi:hypothetical protein
VTAEKTGIPATSSKPRSSEKILQKTQGKKGILRNPGRNVFFIQKTKQKFLKTGITNLDYVCAVDLTILMILSTIAAQQCAPTEETVSISSLTTWLHIQRL